MGNSGTDVLIGAHSWTPDDQRGAGRDAGTGQPGRFHPRRKWRLHSIVVSLPVCVSREVTDATMRPTSANSDASLTWRVSRPPRVCVRARFVTTGTYRTARVRVTLAGRCRSLWKRNKPGKLWPTSKRATPTSWSWRTQFGSCTTCSWTWPCWWRTRYEPAGRQSMTSPTGAPPPCRTINK